MKQLQYTPGPWKIERLSNNRKEWLEIWPDPQDRLGAGVVISTIKLQIGGLDRDRDEANARLIASAPEQQAKIDRLEAEKVELVNTLKLTDVRVCNCPIPWEHIADIIQDIRAAVAKAEPQ